MRKVRVNKVYRHFKGNTYKVRALATHSTTEEVMVIYSNTRNGRLWVRPYNEFLSEVDREKYPDATQKYRFEEVK